MEAHMWFVAQMGAKCGVEDSPANPWVEISDVLVFCTYVLSAPFTNYPALAPTTLDYDIGTSTVPMLGKEDLSLNILEMLGPRTWSGRFGIPQQGPHNRPLSFWAYLVSGFSRGTSTDPGDLGDQVLLGAIKNAYFAILYFAKADINQML